MEYTNTIGTLDGQPNQLSGIWEDFSTGVGNFLNQGADKIDATNKSIEAGTGAINNAVSTYQKMKPYIFGFFILWGTYLATGIVENYYEIKKHGK